MENFANSSFFLEKRAPTLPAPAEVRSLNAQTGHKKALDRNWPPPVAIPSLGLVVKYGTQVFIDEMHVQMMIREKLLGQVHVPEVFGWTQDQGQVFIYMALVEDADPLHERWADMSEKERLSVCAELRQAAQAWRTVEPEEGGRYIGSIRKQPLSDIFFNSRPDLGQKKGPFEGTNAAQKFHDACYIEISPVQTPSASDIVFTHNDLVACNILVTKGPNPKLAAVIDWAQAGWYPGYWEYCKSRYIDVPDDKQFTEALQEEWRQRYLPLILNQVGDKECYYPWLRFALSMI
ncbi:hypothetical protein MGN70_001859 [Eutypa lata]|nr:hypothetical protein MGN70_001859 [Eutypa lata]